jgi:hypothetical protein
LLLLGRSGLASDKCPKIRLCKDDVRVGIVIVNGRLLAQLDIAQEAAANDGLVGFRQILRAKQQEV